MKCTLKLNPANCNINAMLGGCDRCDHYKDEPKKEPEPFDMVRYANTLLRGPMRGPE